MELPSYHYPYHFNYHDNQRELFLDYGTVGQINTESGSPLTIRAQFDRGDNNGSHYGATHPTLPLSSTAEPATSPFEDRVMDGIIQLQKTARDFVSQAKRIKARPGVLKKKNLKKTSQLAKQLQTESSKKGLVKDDRKKLDKMMKPYFRDLLEKYEALSSATVIPTYNCKYAGGVLDCLPCMENGHTGYLVSASGSLLNSLKIQRVTEEGNQLMRSKVIATKELNETIYQVTCSSVSQQGFCGVRTERECLLFSVQEESQDALSLLHTETFFRGPVKPTCIALSPYIPSEFLMVDSSGSCFLLSNERTVSQVLTDVQTEPRFACHSSWRHVNFGSHPRQVVYCDQTALQIFDLRASSPIGKDLFALPSKFLHKKERLCAANGHPASPFYQIVATDFSLILTDLRFPGIPVLQWQHMLPTPPQYLTCVDNLGDADSAIFVGCQRPAETICFTFRKGDNQPPQAVGRPFRICRISDFTEFDGVCGAVDKSTVSQRFQTSLAGQTVLRMDVGFSAFQVDSYGEVYYQLYSNQVSPGSDITKSAGIGTLNPHFDTVAMETGRSWVRSLVKYVKSQTQPKPDLLKDAKKVYKKVVTSLRYPHESCVLCSSVQTVSMEMDDLDYNKCDRCSHPVQVGRALLRADQQQSIVESETMDTELLFSQLPQDLELPQTSVLSRILLKIWNRDTDIKDLLLERDKEVLENRKKRKKKKGDTDASTSDILRRGTSTALQSGEVGMSGGNLNFESEYEDDVSDEEMASVSEETIEKETSDLDITMAGKVSAIDKDESDSDASSTFAASPDASFSQSFSKDCDNLLLTQRTGSGFGCDKSSPSSFSLSKGKQRPGGGTQEESVSSFCESESDNFNSHFKSLSRTKETTKLKVNVQQGFVSKTSESKRHSPIALAKSPLRSEDKQSKSILGMCKQSVCSSGKSVCGDSSRLSTAPSKYREQHKSVLSKKRYSLQSSSESESEDSNRLSRTPSMYKEQHKFIQDSRDSVPSSSELFKDPSRLSRTPSKCKEQHKSVQDRGRDSVSSSSESESKDSSRLSRTPSEYKTRRDFVVSSSESESEDSRRFSKISSKYKERKRFVQDKGRDSGQSSSESESEDSSWLSRTPKYQERHKPVQAVGAKVSLNSDDDLFDSSHFHSEGEMENVNEKSRTLTHSSTSGIKAGDQEQGYLSKKQKKRTGNFFNDSDPEHHQDLKIQTSKSSDSGRKKVSLIDFSEEMKRGTHENSSKLEDVIPPLSSSESVLSRSEVSSLVDSILESEEAGLAEVAENPDEEFFSQDNFLSDSFSQIIFKSFKSPKKSAGTQRKETASPITSASPAMTGSSRNLLKDSPSSKSNTSRKRSDQIKLESPSKRRRAGLFFQ